MEFTGGSMAGFLSTIIRHFKPRGWDLSRHGMVIWHHARCQMISFQENDHMTMAWKIFFFFSIANKHIDSFMATHDNQPAICKRLAECNLVMSSFNWSLFANVGLRKIFFAGSYSANAICQGSEGRPVKSESENIYGALLLWGGCGECFAIYIYSSLV